MFGRLGKVASEENLTDVIDYIIQTYQLIAKLIIIGSVIAEDL